MGKIFLLARRGVEGDRKAWGWRGYRLTVSHLRGVESGGIQLRTTAKGNARIAEDGRTGGFDVKPEVSPDPLDGRSKSLDLTQL